MQSSDEAERLVWSRDVGCPHPHNPQMRAHGGLVSLVGANGHLRIIDPATGLVAVLPDHGGETAYTCFVLGRASGGEYKLLIVTTDYRFHVGGPTRSCKLLTVGGEEGGEWREAQAPPATVRSTRTTPWKAVAADGVVYMLAARLRRDTSHDYIAAFDLDTEQWRQDLIQGPPPLPGHGNVVSSLTELDGRLVAVSGSIGSAANIHLFILLVGGGGNSSNGDDEQEQAAQWQPLCTVPTSPVRCCRQKGMGAEQLVWVLDGGRVAFVVWSGVDDGSQPWVLRLYDPRTKACQDVARFFSPADLAMGTLHRPQLFTYVG